MRLSRLIMLEQLQRIGWPGILGGCLVLASLGYAAIILAPSAAVLDFTLRVA